MRFLKSFPIGVLFALALLACESSERAGIEIGNPQIYAHAFKARFVVDYGFPGANRADSSGLPNVQIDGLELSLSRLAAYSSYYTYVSFNLADGLTLWPERSEDSPMQIAFAEDSSGDERSWDAAFGDVEIDDAGLLKEVGATFAPVDRKSRLTGSMLWNGTFVPFAFSLSGLDSLEVRYLKNQLDSTSNGAISLTVRFCVPAWTGDLPLSSAEKDGDTVRFDASHNALLWDSLSARFGSAFSAKHRIVRYSNGTLADSYDSELLESFDVIDSNWVSNGRFESGLDWIFVEQLGGVADTGIANNIMTVRVVNGGTQTYSVQLIHEDIPLLENRKYKLIFTGVASSPASFTVRLGSYSTYATEAFQKTVVMDTIWKSYEFEYTALVTDLFARLEFNLGKSPNRFDLKDVKIYRID